MTGLARVTPAPINSLATNHSPRWRAYQKSVRNYDAPCTVMGLSFRYPSTFSFMITVTLMFTLSSAHDDLFVLLYKAYRTLSLHFLAISPLKLWMCLGLAECRGFRHRWPGCQTAAVWTTARQSLSGPQPDRSSRAGYWSGRGVSLSWNFTSLPCSDIIN